MNEFILRFGQTQVHMPWWWFHALVIWLGLMGLILFFLGQRLVRPMFAVVGIVLGAAITAVVISVQWPESLVVPWAIGAALIFGGLSLALWRIWMAAVIAWFVFIFGPVLVLLFTGAGAPAIHTPIANTMQQVAEAIGARAAAAAVDSPDAAPDPSPDKDEPNTPGTPGTSDNPAEGGFVAGELGPILADGWANVKTTVAEWWDGVDSSTRWAMIAVSLGGSAVAFVLCLALPYLGAAAATALIGSLLMLPALFMLAARFAPDTALRLQSSPRELVIGLAVATVIGASLQWMLLRRKTDK